MRKFKKLCQLDSSPKIAKNQPVKTCNILIFYNKENAYYYSKIWKREHTFDLAILKLALCLLLSFSCCL